MINFTADELHHVEQGLHRQRGNFVVDVPEIASALAKVADAKARLGFDHRSEGTPVADRAPAKVRSTKPLRDVREIAPGLFIGRDEAEKLILIDANWHRGYVTPWATPAQPDGWRVHVFNALPAALGIERRWRELRRVYPNRAAAERALIREGRKLWHVGEAKLIGLASRPLGRNANGEPNSYRDRITVEAQRALVESHPHTKVAQQLASEPLAA